MYKAVLQQKHSKFKNFSFKWQKNLMFYTPVCSCKFFEKLDLCARHHRKLKPAARRYCVLSTVSRRYPSSGSVALKKVRLLLWCGAVKVNAFLTVAEHTWAAACSIAVPRDWRSVENCCVNLWTVDDSVIRGVSGGASQWEAILGSCVLSQSSSDRIFDCSGYLTIFSENFKRIFLFRRKCIFNGTKLYGVSLRD